MERLQKVIANSGITSRRKAEELILNGKVSVNGKIVTELGTKVEETDKILVNNKPITKEKKEYYILNKPREVISSVNDEKGRKNVVELIDTNARIYPVGRLDYDTTGLIILTNDGEFANTITHPKNSIDKVYVAKIKGIFQIEDLYKLQNGIILDDNFKTSKAKVKLRKIDKEKQTSMVEVTIHEGHNHQVRKMFEKVGYDVIKLKRERIGFLDLGNLKSGEYRKLSNVEVSELLRLARK